MQKNNLVFELQEAINHLRRSKIFDHSRLNLRNAEKHMLFMVSCLKNGDPVMPSEIAEKTGVTMSAVTHQVNALESSGLIKRIQSKDDRRVVTITLSKKGIEKVEKIKKEFIHKIKKFSDYLGEKDTRELIRLIKRLSEIRGHIEEAESNA